MKVTKAIKQVNEYYDKRPDIRLTLLAYLREHMDRIDDDNFKRKVRSYPADLSDARLAVMASKILS